RTTELIFLGTVKPSEQEAFVKPGEILRLAPKIFTRDCYIDWNGSANEIHNKIRGLSPYPGARTCLKSNEKKITIKLLKSQPYMAGEHKAPGSLSTSKGNSLCIAASDGSLEILKLQPEGKRKMTSDEFLRGFNIEGYSAT
ncbi:MAG: methionyl-tRNA formyltransferase, partial [Bacteroidia bacterium]